MMISNFLRSDLMGGGTRHEEMKKVTNGPEGCEDHSSELGIVRRQFNFPQDLFLDEFPAHDTVRNVLSGVLSKVEACGFIIDQFAERSAREEEMRDGE
jgi:hypothetical protein